MIQYVKSIKHPDFITQTDRTLSQLKNSGGMRLIKSEAKINALIKYEELFEKLYNQQVWYEGGLKDLLNSGISIFNFSYLTNNTTEMDKEDLYNTIKLLKTNESQIVELGNRASVSSAFTFAYLMFLKDTRKECNQLIEVLKSSNP